MIDVGTPPPHNPFILHSLDTNYTHTHTHTHTHINPNAQFLTIALQNSYGVGFELSWHAESCQVMVAPEKKRYVKNSDYAKDFYK